jgi:hypothetical protein
MLSRSLLLVGAMVAALAVSTVASAQEKAGKGLTIDKEARTVTIDCAVAPRKLPNLKEIYPIEVIACWPAEKKGQKAHETVVTFQVKPSDVHKALESLGLKAGKPARGEIGKATGPEVKLFLDIPAAGGGAAKRIPIEQALVDTKSGKPVPTFKWVFTGSNSQMPDPEKDDKVYGADVTGTLITVYPVTDDTVIQSTLTAKDEGKFRLEINKDVLPPTGGAVKLVIQAK